MPVISDFYVYETDFAAIAAGATVTNTINIQADADFVVQKLTYFADLAAAAQTDSGRVIPLVSVLITDTGSGRQLMSSAVPVPNIFGTGEIPYILTQPKIFAARSNIQIQVSNFSAATAYNLKLSLIGVKQFNV